MTRQQFLRISGLSGMGGILASCEGLRELEKRPEGAGVQVISGAIFLAKYQATPRQVAQARQKGATVYVARALKPVTEEKLRALKARPPAPARAAATPPPAPEAQEKERQAVAASYYAIVRKAVGGEVPPGLRLAAAPVADIPPDPSMTRELLAAVNRRQLVEQSLAVRVSGSGMAVEQQNPGAVTVMNYDTRALDLADENAFVLRSAPKPGELLALGGTRAVYRD